LISEDGSNYQKVADMQVPAAADDQFRTVGLSFKAAKARFVKVIAQHFGIIPTGLPGASNHAWMFIDEIMVN
jgi:hypothetical protein